MTTIIIYGDLVKEIETLELRVGDLEREGYALERLNRNNGIPYDQYLNKISEINNSIAILQSILEDKKKTRSAIEQRINNFEGLEYQVAYKKLIERKDLMTIAEELHISYDYAKKKSAKVGKTHF
ncbi:hypothetical protein [Dethiothermospora halolimnae]|uniref:hypothetical protein n=1 Tax=Dethiothermospora halolimnae TaxID=3114390 RepID=UPI003CCC3130